MNTDKKSLILITGAGGGMGCQLAEYLISQGYLNLALVYRNRFDEIKALLKKHDLDEKKHLFQANLNDESSVSSLRNDIENSLGEVDVLVNLAGSSTNGVSWKLSKEDFSKIIEDNLISTFLTTKEFIPAMRSKSNGRIINISSVVATTGIAGASHYAASKAGILGFTRSVALELAPKNITVNAISLGYFNCGLIDHVPLDLQENIKSQIPLKRFGLPTELGALIEYIISPDAAYTTGQNFQINGGLCL
jgi:3-oxoacyl-[acyl-carrier protein] reductase